MNIIGDIIIILGGVMILVDPIVTDLVRNYTWNFTPIKYPLGFGMIIGGIILIYTDLRKRRREKHTESSDDQTTEE